ncbi:Uncharacterised protein [Streptococcus criceti]|uniref:Uncharacterized protein n=1 Tax=Streptococcus criceti HS-6 TaxID=873449 RepID=G5JNA6_STRCG|nr:hypothetical protein STRCR_0143 [Streptococcus criceti HS-6]SUN41655.1 Uncharacterised protein [Streptococcus criceti]
MFQFLKQLFRRSAVTPNGPYPVFHQPQQMKPAPQSVQGLGQTG